jgi:hypothetical protein
MKRNIAVMANRSDDWVIKLTSGHTSLPVKFWDSYRMIRSTAEANMVKSGVLREKAMAHFAVRYAVSFLCFFVNIGLRRKQRRAREK